MTSEAYGISNLSNVTILTNTLVKRVVIEENDGEKVATEVELADAYNTKFEAHREVIVSAGAYRTPQVLLLSGIGSTEELAKHNIPQLVNAQEVGRNYHDHLALCQWWKLRKPEQGASLGTPLWTDPSFFLGLPVDWNVTENVPSSLIKKALKADGETNIDGHPLVEPNFCHTESLIVYASAGAQITGVQIREFKNFIPTEGYSSLSLLPRSEIGLLNRILLQQWIVLTSLLLCLQWFQLPEVALG